MSPRRRLLWADDDGPKHFLYELSVLESRGWVVRWACSVEEAVRALRAEPFDALLLDQLMPVAEAGNCVVAERFVWSGALLVAWLRDPAALEALPAAVRAASAAVTAAPPHPENLLLPLQLVSAFDDPEVDALLAKPTLGAPRRIAKPVDLDDLLLLIDEAEAERAAAEAETQVGGRGGGDP